MKQFLICLFDICWNEVHGLIVDMLHEMRMQQKKELHSLVEKKWQAYAHECSRKSLTEVYAQQRRNTCDRYNCRLFHHQATLSKKECPRIREQERTEEREKCSLI